MATTAHVCPDCGTATESITVDQAPLFDGPTERTITRMCPAAGCGWHSRPKQTVVKA